MKRKMIFAILLLMPLMMYQNCGSGFKSRDQAQQDDVYALFDQEGGLVGPLPPIGDPIDPIEPDPVDDQAIPSNCTHGANEYGPYPSGAEPDKDVDSCTTFSALNKIVFVKAGVDGQLAKTQCVDSVKHVRTCRDKLAVYNPNNPPDLSNGRYVIQDRAYRLY